MRVLGELIDIYIVSDNGFNFNKRLFMLEGFTLEKKGAKICLTESDSYYKIKSKVFKDKKNNYINIFKELDLGEYLKSNLARNSSIRVERFSFKENVNLNNEVENISVSSVELDFLTNGVIDEMLFDEIDINGVFLNLNNINNLSLISDKKIDIEYIEDEDYYMTL